MSFTATAPAPSLPLVGPVGTYPAGMSRPQLRRVLATALALAVAWPAAVPVDDLAHADQSALAATGPAADEHGHGVRGTCPAVFCYVPPAVLPGLLPDHADAGRPVRFVLADAGR